MGKGLMQMFRRRARPTDMEDLEARRAARGFAGNKQIMDPTPMAPPIGYKKQPSMVEHLREMVRSELLRREVEGAGFETFEEADDFDIGDGDDLPKSPYEMEDVFEPPAKAAEADKSKEAPTPPPTPPPAEKPSEGGE